MRALFLLLLGANVLLFAWAKGYWGGQEAAGEGERLQRQLAEEKLRIVPAAEQLAALAAPACRRIESLTAAEAESLKNAVGAAAGWKVALLPGLPTKFHWVAIADLPSQAMAEKKSREAAKLGADNGEIVEDAANGPFLLRFGAFESQAAAEALHQSLAGKGVRSARLLVREAAADKHALELRAPAAEMKAKLPTLLGLLPQARAADCPNP